MTATVGGAGTMLGEHRTIRAIEAQRLAGCSYRQLDYWCRQYPICEGRPLTPGSGLRRRFTVHEVKILRTFTTLGEAGVVVSPYAQAIIGALNGLPSAEYVACIPPDMAVALVNVDDFVSVFHEYGNDRTLTLVPIQLLPVPDDLPDDDEEA